VKIEKAPQGAFLFPAFAAPPTIGKREKQWLNAKAVSTAYFGFGLGVKGEPLAGKFIVDGFWLAC
jgi:hypothetical protein